MALLDQVDLMRLGRTAGTHGVDLIMRSSRNRHGIAAARP
jgi:hypothetical protein